MDEQDQPRYGLADLAEEAGVSIRTVRYYIAEGLLPPPVGAGPRSAYSAGHLDRLRLIGRLKDAFLPLREIRRRLDGLDDSAVRDLLLRLGPAAGRRSPTAVSDERLPADSAADYLARVMERPPAGRPYTIRQTGQLRTDRPAAAPPRPTTVVGEAGAVPEQDVKAAFERSASDWSESLDSDRRPSDAPAALDLDPAIELAAPPAEPSAVTDGPWRRVAIGSDAELLIREDAYLRRRDRVEWLIGWARKVFS